MMIFTSIYGVVDGFFVSNFVGKTSFAAVNFIMPFLMVFGAMGFTFGTGGSALIAKIMGEGEDEKAQQIFSLLIAATVVSGVIIAVLGILFLRPIAILPGAQGDMLENSVLYGRIILVALPYFLTQKRHRITSVSLLCTFKTTYSLYLLFSDLFNPNPASKPDILKTPFSPRLDKLATD